MKNALSVLYGLCDSRNYKFSLKLRGVRYRGYQLRGGGGRALFTRFKKCILKENVKHHYIFLNKKYIWPIFDISLPPLIFSQ